MLVHFDEVSHLIVGANHSVMEQLQCFASPIALSRANQAGERKRWETRSAPCLCLVASWLLSARVYQPCVQDLSETCPFEKPIITIISPCQ